MYKISVEGGENPGIYKITQKSTGKIYIGQTSVTINSRLTQHASSVKPEQIDEESKSIDSAIAKFGVDDFEFKALCPIPNATQEQLWAAEAFNINEFDSKDKGFNLTKGNHLKELYEGYNKHKKDFYSVTHKVFFDIIRRKFNLDFENKKVLLVNRFDNRIKESLEDIFNSNVSVIYTDSSYDESENDYAKD